jgi:hypothetical protein
MKVKVIISEQICRSGISDKKSHGLWLYHSYNRRHTYRRMTSMIRPSCNAHYERKHPHRVLIASCVSSSAGLERLKDAQGGQAVRLLEQSQLSASTAIPLAAAYNKAEPSTPAADHTEFDHDLRICVDSALARVLFISSTKGDRTYACSLNSRIKSFYIANSYSHNFFFNLNASITRPIHRIAHSVEVPH